MYDWISVAGDRAKMSELKRGNDRGAKIDLCGTPAVVEKEQGLS